MVSIKKTLVLTASVATSAFALVIPRADTANINEDPCTTLSSLNTTDIQLKHVADCYNAIPWDKDRDVNFVANLTALYDNFYIYKDLALVSAGAPFDNPSVDIMADFNELIKREYKRAHDFHNDVRLAVARLYDAHTTYAVKCFRIFNFKQPIALYAPVIDGKQSVRVYADETGHKHNLRDCEVVAIDNEEPLGYIQKWADRHTAYSKDPGVRLNHVLASTVFDSETGLFTPDLGLFNTHNFLPEKPSIEYQISCPNDNGAGFRRFDLKATFKVIAPPITLPFNDTGSFAQFCTEQPIDEGEEGEEEEEPAGMRLQPRLLHTEHQQERVQIARRTDPSPRQDLKHASVVARTKSCGFYQLREDPSVGVVLISTMMISTKEYQQFLDGLDALARNNVTHLIIDLTNNGGGLVRFASDLVSFFFKTPSATQGSHRADLRTTASLVRLGMADFTNKNLTTFYDPVAFVDETGAEMTEKLYLSPVNHTRGGRTSEYTPSAFLAWNNTAEDIRFPWSQDASKIKILTDGQCGSACGMTTDHFVTRHGVQVYAVGGYQNKPLSMYSFAGASVMKWDLLSKCHLALEIPAPMDFPTFSGAFNIPWLEVYSHDDPVPLDYSNERYPAQHRLDYTPDSARHHDSLWKAVADNAWGK